MWKWHWVVVRACGVLFPLLRVSGEEVADELQRYRPGLHPGASSRCQLHIHALVWVVHVPASGLVQVTVRLPAGDGCCALSAGRLTSSVRSPTHPQPSSRNAPPPARRRRQAERPRRSNCRGEQPHQKKPSSEPALLPGGEAQAPLKPALEPISQIYTHSMTFSARFLI